MIPIRLNSKHEIRNRPRNQTLTAFLVVIFCMLGCDAVTTTPKSSYRIRAPRSSKQDLSEMMKELREMERMREQQLALPNDMSLARDIEQTRQVGREIMEREARDFNEMKP